MNTQLVTFGEAMISLRSTGFIAQGDGFTSALAGAETNVAIGVARLGHTASWVGAVGADEPGELIARTLRAEGVHAALRVDETRTTGLMLVERRLGTTARVTYYRAGSAGSALTTQDVTDAITPGTQILHLTGITPALSQSAREAALATVATAKQHGVLVSFDVNFRGKLWSEQDARPVLTELARQADILIASDDELALLGEADEQAAVTTAFAHGSRIVVIKRGAHGVSVFTPTQRTDVAARRVSVVDTIGAGDAFTAGFLSGILDELTPQQAAQRGVTVAAFAVAAPGDWDGLPRRDELSLMELEDGGTVR